jgi:hypothetical protein
MKKERGAFAEVSSLRYRMRWRDSETQKYQVQSNIVRNLE